MPKSLAKDLTLFVSSLIIPRKHLPAGALTHSYLPILVHADTHAILIVAARYWAPDLFNHWMSE